MSMIVTFVVPSGIVMAADSATTLFTFADMKNIFMGNYEQAVKNSRAGSVPQTDENVMRWSTASRYTNKINVMRSNNIALIHGSGMTTKGEVGIDPYIENFCLKNDFDIPGEAAQAVLEYIRGGFPDQEAYFMVGGYNHTDGDIPFPETWHVDLKGNKITRMTGKGQYGMLLASANEYFNNFRELVNKNAHCFALQDAVDITMWAFDICMKCERFIDLKRIIWPPIDVLTITSRGVEWVQRKKPEIKELEVM
jgi:hypothetical protein